MAGKRYKVEITAVAECDSWEIHDYIAHDKPAAARRWIDGLSQRIESPATTPERHAVIPEAEELGISYRHTLFGTTELFIELMADESSSCVSSMVLDCSTLRC